MTAQIRPILLVIFLVRFLVSTSTAQVQTGIPKFGSFGGGEFDILNLGNLNVHFTVPILHKAGRGIPFSYDLGYDSSIYQIVTSNGNSSWQPVGNIGGSASYWGWQGLGPVFTPYVGYTVTYGTGLCGLTNQYTYQYWQFGNFVYHDTVGTSHPLPAGGVYYDSAICGQYGPPNGAHPSGVATGQSTDGSGYTINWSVGQGSAWGYLNTASGTTLNVPWFTSAPTASPYTAQDANGNKITYNNGVYTDTLGTTALTVTGSQPNPVFFTYTGPAGSQFYKVNFSPYNIKTAFNCTSPSIQDYTSTGSVYLISSIVLPDGSQYSFSYEDTPNNAGYKTGRVSQVTLPTGGTIAYSYTFSGPNDGISCSDGSTVAVQRSLTPGGVWQYTRTGSGAAWTTTQVDPAINSTVIDFEKGFTTPNLFETRRRLYQGSPTGTLLKTSITCYNGQNVGSPGNCYNTAITAQITRITNFRYLPDSSGLQSETDFTYDNFGLIQEADEYGYGNAAVGSVIRKTITGYTALGNGIADRPSSVTIKDSANAVKAYTSYGYDQTTPLTPSGTTPQWTSVSGSRGNLTSVTAQVNGSVNLYRKYTYYNTGMLATSTDVSTSSTTNGASTTYNYNNTGTPSPSCGNSFVTSISEPVGSMSRSFGWDCNGGVSLSVTDENGNVSSTAYSGTNYTNVFWRPYSSTDENGNTTDYFYYLNTATPPIEFQTESKYHVSFNNGSSTVDKVATADGFHRTSFVQTKQMPSSINYDTVATCYDNFGRASFVSLPYSTTVATSSSTCPYPSNRNGTTTTYDAAGRLYQVTAGDGGQTTFTYSKNNTLEAQTSPTVSKQSEFDSLGSLISVCEINSGTTAWPSASCGQNTTATGYLTTYGYDVLGNRTTVTQNAQATGTHQTRNFAYDMLSRLTSETNPENNNLAMTYKYDTLTSDTNCGTITSAGNLLKTLDPAGNAVCYSSYDALHRVGVITYPSGGDPTKHFIYDTATVNSTAMTNAKTRLAEAYTCIGTCSSKLTDLGFSYGPTGQQKDVWELTPHSGSNYYFHVTATPWPNGAVNTISNLVGLPTITYGADGEGRISSVSASSGQSPLVSTVGYDPASHVTGLTYGSSDTDAFTFYATTGRMNTYTFTMGSTPKTQTGTLSWNTNGTLQQLAIVDQINSANTQTCNYTHDSLGRTASSNCGTAIWNQNFSYDPFGNITKTVPNGSTGTAFQPNYDYTNYTNRITSSPYTYSGNNGAITADISHTYTWDTGTRLSKVDSGASNGVCATYDALDRVVEQATGANCATSPTGTTEIVYSPAGVKLALMNGSTLVKAFVGLPGGAQAVYNGSGLLYYRHPDWLGSSRLATTPSRTCYWDSAYAPFGENYAPPASGCIQQDLNFTGQNQDTESSVPSGGQGGLYDFMFRRFSPSQGRWLSPDPAGLAAANPSDPQTWNRYAYIGNRSLNATDPLGLDPCDPFFPSVGCCWYYYCIQPPCGPDDPYCNACDPNDPYCYGPPPGGGGGGSGGGGGGGGGSAPPPPQRAGGKWPNNETLGLPGGLNMHPLGSLGDLLGLSPGTQCGDFVSCGSLGPGINAFSAGTIALPSAGEISTAAGALALRLAGVIGLLLIQQSDATPCAQRPTGCHEGFEECLLESSAPAPHKPDWYVCTYYCPYSGKKFAQQWEGKCPDPVLLPNK